jgi:hypothetical protein
MQLEVTMSIRKFKRRECEAKGEGGDVLIGHEGEDPGVNTLMYFRAKDQAGVIVLTNANSKFPAAPVVTARLFEEAAHR